MNKRKSISKSTRTSVYLMYNGTISLIKDLKYYLDLATEEKTHTCNCNHNSNSRDNELCYRCDSRMTTADRIRNMSDEELADYLATVTSDVICGSSWDYDEWIKELQSEAE